MNDPFGTASFDPLDDTLDRIWAGSPTDTSKRFNNYYDYYFSGEDVKIYIDGLFDPEDELDIASFAYSIRQEKQPLYGFWSYNYDTVMFGTRIISGEISMFTRHPRRMTDFMEKAAAARLASAKEWEDNKRNTVGDSAIKSRLTPGSFSASDEKNIQKYWAYSQLDRITNDVGLNGKNIFSAHPPFNFIILFGAEEVALTPYSVGNSPDINISDNLDRMIHTDVNQRTVRTGGTNSPTKMIIQQVNLMNMTTQFTPGGQPVVESYQFIARDFYHSSVDLSFIKTMSTFNASDSDSVRDAGAAGGRNTSTATTWTENTGRR
jgi:hypothetical protein